MAGMDSLSNYYLNGANSSMMNKAAESSYKNSSMDAYGLDMSDFLSLMVAQFTNQGLESSADIGDMLNQLVQMQMVTALASMSTTMETMTDHSIMSYAASLVGKEVTVAGYDADENYTEIVGTVTATGSYGGEQVIFVDDQMFYMTQIIAVGRLPAAETGETGGTENAGSTGGTGSTSGTTGGGMPSSGGTGGTTGGGMPSSGSIGGAAAASAGTDNAASESSTAESENSAAPESVSTVGSVDSVSVNGSGITGIGMPTGGSTIGTTGGGMPSSGSIGGIVGVGMPSSGGTGIFAGN